MVNKVKKTVHVIEFNSFSLNLRLCSAELILVKTVRCFAFQKVQFETLGRFWKYCIAFFN